MKPIMNTEQYLGIDIGGNHVKMGFVDRAGVIHDFQSYPTAEWRATGDFVGRLIDTIQFRLISHKETTRVGIGLPGMLSKDRSTPLIIPAIPELDNVPLLQRLTEALPQCEFILENDANAAALGELLFAHNGTLPDTFAFVTMGTGIGSAAVIERKIFTGGDGNGLELGHIPSRGSWLEHNVGKQGIIRLATEKLPSYPKETLIPRDQPVSATKLVVSAENKDEFSQQVFFEVGEILGEGLVSLIRIMDITDIVIGGGLSASFEFVKPGIEKVIHEYLPPYYTNKLSLTRATLGNDAGLLGAASLCFEK
ncbi:glucokinase [Flexibacter flexilis DSM 6793]|uniref:Glucokinase n=1 Tax=Flexibacter flexilis DSM 6793 TaxID=927664 RepID=A0A1I1H1W5_9BACT|nr:ROK family protein [Flexibacter flexilis]SFC17532.1 glucokinase [Flexibacter flexilis DSM 6793]